MPELSTNEATEIVKRYLNKDLVVTKQYKITSNLSNGVVFEWITNGTPATIFVKMTEEYNSKELCDEFEALAWYRNFSNLPVPKSYALVLDEKYEFKTFLLLEKVNGLGFNSIDFSTGAMRVFQKEFAMYIARLHSTVGKNYGYAFDPRRTYETWIDWFRPELKKVFASVRKHFSTDIATKMVKIISRLEDYLPEHNQPVLVHGNIIPSSIIVDDDVKDSPVIKSFVGGLAFFADVEFELANLRISRTADDTFFEEYRKRHNLRPGFEKRSRIYWLHTMLKRVYYSELKYLVACERLVNEILD